MFGRSSFKLYKHCFNTKNISFCPLNKKFTPCLFSMSARSSGERKEKKIKIPLQKEVDLVFDGESYFKHRCEFVEDSKRKGMNLFAHKFSVSHSPKDIFDKYDLMSSGDASQDEVSLAGRILTIRKHSKKLWFLDVQNQGLTIQVICNAKFFDSTNAMEKECHNACIGDIVGVCGSPYRTPAGELSIRVTNFEILTPCLRLLPSNRYGLLDQQTRQRQRYLDLLFNSESRKNFLTRSKIIKYIRQYLDERGFVEVETPMLNTVASGAAAKPFKTFHTSLQYEFFLRVAPELYLKMLIVGGLDKVFEIGRVFRNEGLSEQHNPEFTCCEFYTAYADYQEILVLTEDLLSKLVYELFGSYEFEYNLPGRNEATLLNFKPPFNRIEFIPALEEALNTKLPEIQDLNSSKARNFLVQLCNDYYINIEPNSSSSKLLDKLFDHLVVKEKCANPTFVINHPLIMSPLAKQHPSEPWLSERFELYIGEMEICNAYSELNDPLEQRKRFQEQVRERMAGDEEVVIHDEEFCASLEYGMPPAAGWGMGIDRLAMILTNSPSIKNVILFPSMRPAHKTKEDS